MVMDELARTDVAAFLKRAEHEYGDPAPVSKRNKPTVVVKTD